MGERNVQKVRILADPSSLIPELANVSPGIRRHAREALATLGRQAVMPLIELLKDHRTHVRWEAAKALANLADPTAAKALIDVMENDDDSDVRWLAAEGIVAIGRQGARELLLALLERPYSSTLREGGAHVFHRLSRKKPLKGLKSVVAALRSYEPEWIVPSAVQAALHQLQGMSAAVSPP